MGIFRVRPESWGDMSKMTTATATAQTLDVWFCNCPTRNLNSTYFQKCAVCGTAQVPDDAVADTERDPCPPWNMFNDEGLDLDEPIPFRLGSER